MIGESRVLRKKGAHPVLYRPTRLFAKSVSPGGLVATFAFVQRAGSSCEGKYERYLSAALRKDWPRDDSTTFALHRIGVPSHRIGGRAASLHLFSFFYST